MGLPLRKGYSFSQVGLLELNHTFLGGRKGNDTVTYKAFLVWEALVS